MTKEEFNLLSSSANAEKCPDCGSNSTEPNPNCPCRIYYGYHVMRFHHVCKQKDMDFIKNQMKEKES